MNEIEKQILKNQHAIINFLRYGIKETNNQDFNEELDSNLDRTSDILNPPKQESIAERTHDALSQSNEKEIICAYCKEKEVTNHSSPPCCGSKECTEHWKNDKASWDADCEREHNALEGKSEEVKG